MSVNFFDRTKIETQPQAPLITPLSTLHTHTPPPLGQITKPGPITPPPVQNNFICKKPMAYNPPPPPKIKAKNGVGLNRKKIAKEPTNGFDTIYLGSDSETKLNALFFRIWETRG